MPLGEVLFHQWILFTSSWFGFSMENTHEHIYNTYTANTNQHKPIYCNNTCHTFIIIQYIEHISSSKDWIFNGHEFEQALGDGKGQGSLACCSPWGRKESDATELLNNNLFARLQLTYPSLRNLAPLSLSVFNLFGQSHVTACLLSDFCHLLSLPDFSRWPDAPSVFTSDICAYLAWPLEPNGI